MKTSQIVLIDGHVVSQPKFDLEFATHMKSYGEVVVKHKYSSVLDQYSTDILTPECKPVSSKFGFDGKLEKERYRSTK